MIPFIGLTGSIGSGKSTALECFERLGCATLSSDAVVHDIYTFDVVRDAVVDRWGAEIAPDGMIDRAAVAERAFASPFEREWLEQLLWPLVGAEIEGWLEALEEQEKRPKAAVVEVPLLFEAEMQGLFAATVVVVADDSVRDRRAQERGHVAVSDRHDRQLPQEEKARLADHVIENHGSVEDLEAQIEDLLLEITA